MRSGYLSDYFCGVAVKRLSAVETNLERSHQHEFNASRELIALFGSKKSEFSAEFSVPWR